MKLKEFFYLLGAKPKAVRYGVTVESAELSEDGRVEYGRWLHPKADSPAPSQQQIRNWRRVLQPGDVAIDVGAHVGDSSLPIALAVGPTGTVLALEPNPFVFPTLEATARLNPGKANIIPLRFAATREDGPVSMHFGERGYCNGGIHEGVSRWVHGSAYQVTVDGVRLETLLHRSYPHLLEKLRLIKIDTEGYDLAVLETVTELLTEQRPFLQVEFFNPNKSPAGYRHRLFDYLRGHRYRVALLDERSPVFLAHEITPRNLLERKSFDGFCCPEELVGSLPWPKT